VAQKENYGKGKAKKTGQKNSKSTTSDCIGRNHCVCVGFSIQINRRGNILGVFAFSGKWHDVHGAQIYVYCGIGALAAASRARSGLSLYLSFSPGLPDVANYSYHTFL
jgi:hypothetical protein